VLGQHFRRLVKLQLREFIQAEKMRIRHAFPSLNVWASSRLQGDPTPESSDNQKTTGSPGRWLQLLAAYAPCQGG
jgi:hypothetical protein